MRQYQPIWEKLKKKHTVSITATPLFHRRIIKAVVKEKWMDIAFKIEHQPKYAILTHSIRGSIIEFKLTFYRDLSLVTEKNL